MHLSSCRTAASRRTAPVAISVSLYGKICSLLLRTPTPPHPGMEYTREAATDVFEFVASAIAARRIRPSDHRASSRKQQ